MLQIIGLIVSAYAMARLLQVPLEMSASSEEWLGLPLWIRFMVVAGISLIGLVVIALLTLVLLFSGSPSPAGY